MTEEQQILIFNSVTMMEGFIKDIQQRLFCNKCKYNKNNPDGGHCYMFEEIPKLDRICRQFTE